MSTIAERIPLANCFRCGIDFHRIGSHRICFSCRSPKTDKCLSSNLSFREKQVIELVVQALLNKQIAHELHLTEGTVKEYLNRIFRKTGVTNRTQLAVWSIRQSSPKLQLVG